jgi:phospholipid N-methyltransferase
MEHTATYSPEDNKIRITPAYRLDAEEYARVKAAGYIWAPRQEIFVAPMWTPGREDLALEMCGEIGDEDTSLVDRAEERAERFIDYSEKRAEDAERAHNAVAAITDNIPMGQPILVGHHSEKHARKDAERIENGMRKAVNMWETSKYWKMRAAGALHHAKYKERPDVRARRIKGLESDKRKEEKERKEAETWLSRWTNIMDDSTMKKKDGSPSTAIERARFWSNYCRLNVANVEGKTWDIWHVLQPDEDRYRNCPAMTVEQVQAVAVAKYPRIIAHCDRWINHIENRLEYERAMLNESGGLITDKFDIEIGGKVLVRGEWVVILKINKAGGKINSLATNRRYVSKIGIEEAKDYQAPEAGEAEKVKKAMALPPLCNYPGEGIVEATKEQWEQVKGRGDCADTEVIRNDTTAPHRRRRVMSFIARRWGYTGPGHDQQWGMIGVFITDEKRKDPPQPTNSEPIRIDAPERVETRTTYQAPEPTKFDDMRDALKEGVKVVVAPQLFPTPPEIAEMMVEYAEIEKGNTVLEPSAGTGNIMQAIMNDNKAKAVVAVEINQTLAQHLKGEYPLSFVHCFDFLTYDRGKWPVDRIIMNPPFENGIDIKHINHALTMLKPGGRLVALCANGSRQQAAFKERADHWEVLPEGSFKEQGTGVNVALMVMNKPEERKQFQDGLF